MNCSKLLSSEKIRQIIALHKVETVIKDIADVVGV